MKNLRTLVLLISFLLCVGNFVPVTNLAQENSSENERSGIETVRVKDISKALNQKEREALVQQLTSIYITSVRQHESDYISAKAPLYLLFKANFQIFGKEKKKEV